MADRSIGQLPEATTIGATDLLVMEQAGTAKKVQGRTLLAWLDGHGGIADIDFNADDTMTITAADGAVWTSNSLRGPDGVSPTVSVLQAPATPTTPTAYLITITDKDGDHVFTLYDGAKGVKGDIGVHGSDVSVTVSDAAATDEHSSGGKTLTITETVYSYSGSAPTQNSTNVTIWNGNKGDKGNTGETGPKGDPGNSYVVKGLYATLAALQAAHPTGSEGDAWFVGTSDSNVVYQWDVDKAAWVNAGALKGPKGDKGDKGNPGEAGKSAYEAAQDGGYTGTETAFNALLAQVGNKVDKSTIVEVTLLAANWAGTEAPYTYTAAVAGVTTTSTQDWANGTSITAEQLAAWQAANIVDGGQGIGSVTFKAFGAKPEVDIPLRCILRRDT